MMEMKSKSCGKLHNKPCLQSSLGLGMLWKWQLALPPPTNVTEWFIRVRDATAKAKLLPIAPQLNSTYLLSWHVRALLRDRMASAGITKLAINTECSIYQLMNWLCLDQSSCLLREVYQYWSFFQKLQLVVAGVTFS